ncbi:MAG: 2-oxo acid dehydrogenase subunit E2 [Clostridia bacterium]|nr:2-oxo acid dehydrogenase subunit E2 [Clostridia bacterium]
MAVGVLMPKVGITVESCVITKWYKKEGDAVKQGDVLFAYETDKASVEEEAKVDGTLIKIFAGEGDDVPCLTNVAVIGKEGEDYSEFAPKNEEEEETPEEPAKAEEKAEEKVEAPVVEVKRAEGEMIKISPRARSLAAKLGVDPALVAGTGPYGRIVSEDIEAAAKSGKVFTKAALGEAGAANATGTGIGGRVTVGDLANGAAAESGVAEPEYVDEPLSNVRKVIARSMTTSLSTMAQLTNNTSFDATALINYRKLLKTKGEALGVNGITISDIIIYAVSRTLKNHRSLNAHLLDDKMRFFNGVHIGIACDTDRGLLVPTLFNADKMSLLEISKKSKEIIADTKAGKVSPDLLHGASFTVSNLGTMGIESFTPVINPPQTGILGLCATVERVRTVDGQITTYPAMGLSLTYDHRAVDGAPASLFLKELCTNLENIDLLLAK